MGYTGTLFSHGYETIPGQRKRTTFGLRPG